VLAYPNPQADRRFPGQLLYGGFAKDTATYLVGGFGVFFLVGMGLWMLVLARMRRTTTMLIGLAGLMVAIGSMALINGLAENPESLAARSNPAIWPLCLLVVAGILLLSGFTPSALTHMGAISETMPGKRGAVMGLYSVVLAIGQLLGVFGGGIAVDLGGFYGLLVFGGIMGIVSLISVVYMRLHGHDLLKTFPHSL
jgi:MFS family permease